MINRPIVLLLGIFLLGDAATINAHHGFTGPTVRVGRPCNDPNRPSMDKVGHINLDVLLQKYVNSRGMVAYGKWKANPQDMRALDNYLNSLSCVNLRKPASKTAQLAYWINAYNAVTIKGILREYPTSSILNHTARFDGYNIWRDLELCVDGRYFSLDDIEHKMLRKMGEPRIHFAVNCASIGCPVLANRAYTVKNLENMLVRAARRFFDDPANFRVDANQGIVYVSQLLQWYGTDFHRSPVQQMRILSPYFSSASDRNWISSTNFTVRYLRYNWKLNDQSPPK